MRDTIRILSIDGGGIRGIVPAIVLAALENWTGQPVSNLFDLVAGTSTGGILALGLLKPGPEGRPAYSADDMAALYEREGRQIFARGFWHKLRSLGSLREEKYASNGIDAVLRRYFGETKLSEALAPAVIPAYEIERRAPFLFKSAAARRHATHDFPMWQAARATSAAPTYFEPARLAAKAGDYFALIDGGVYANNPALCALVEAMAEFPHARRFVVCSLGTGALTRRFPIEEAKNWGLARWAKPVLEIVLDSVSATVDYQMRQLLPHGQYLRLQPALQKGEETLDAISERRIRDLRLAAENLVADRARDLESLCGELLR
jgi:uncharacterized protein